MIQPAGASSQGVPTSPPTGNQSGSVKALHQVEQGELSPALLEPAVMPSFLVAWRGYDRSQVDNYVRYQRQQLAVMRLRAQRAERELARMRTVHAGTMKLPADELATAAQRVGELEQANPMADTGPYRAEQPTTVSVGEPRPASGRTSFGHRPAHQVKRRRKQHLRRRQPLRGLLR